MPTSRNMAPNEINVKSDDTASRHTVLVARLGVLGDIVMAIPVIYSVCYSYPDIRFVMLTDRKLARVFIVRPENLTIETRDLGPEHNATPASYATARELMRKHHYDLFIDLQNDRSTRMIRLYCLLNRIKTVTFNHADSHCRSLTRRSNKVMLPVASARARYLATFFAAGLPAVAEFDGLFGKGLKADPALFSSLTPPKSPGEKWIGIAPFAAYATKEYPAEKMEEVIQALSAEPDTRIFIFGDKGREADTARAWQQTLPRVTSLAGGAHDFATELALMSHLDVMLTMDSANMHLAALTGAPLISVWGATHHYCGFRAWHQQENDMVQLPLSCRPCSITGNKPCFRHDRLCLTALRPETILSKIQEKLR